MRPASGPRDLFAMRAKLRSRPGMTRAGAGRMQEGAPAYWRRTGPALRVWRPDAPCYDSEIRALPRKSERCPAMCRHAGPGPPPAAPAGRPRGPAGAAAPGPLGQGRARVSRRARRRTRRSAAPERARRCPIFTQRSHDSHNHDVGGCGRGRVSGAPKGAACRGAIRPAGRLRHPGPGMSGRPAARAVVPAQPHSTNGPAAAARIRPGRTTRAPRGRGGCGEGPARCGP